MLHLVSGHEAQQTDARYDGGIDSGSKTSSLTPLQNRRWIFMPTI
jgi:hypothetical protein